MMHAGLALGGGGGLAHLLIRLFIWHLIWRLGLLIWRVPTVGPELVVVIVIALVVLAILRSRRGSGWPGSRWPGRRPGNPFRDRTSDEAGPRDW